MTRTCSVYGLGLRLNVDLAGLAGLPPVDRTDVDITVGPLPAHLGPVAAEPFYTSADLDEGGQPLLRAWRGPGGYRIAFSDGTAVALAADGSRVWAATPAGRTLEDTGSYLLGPILGVVLRLRGIPCLHASAVAVGDRAIALVGASGAGKSSTAAAFARLGQPVLSDDVVALRAEGDSFRVQPAYPRIRLWPETVAGLFGSADALPRITPGWDKRYLDLNGPGGRFQGTSLPLAAIYWLGDRGEGSGPATVAALRPREALIHLLTESYATHFQDQALRAQEFQLLGRLVTQLPVRRLHAGNGLDRIGARCAAILADFRCLDQQPA